MRPMKLLRPLHRQWLQYSNGLDTGNRPIPKTTGRGHLCPWETGRQSDKGTLPFEPCDIALFVDIVLAVGLGKSVIAGVIRIGAHKNVIVAIRIEDGIDRLYLNNTDRPGRQAFIYVCIVR